MGRGAELFSFLAGPSAWACHFLGSHLLVTLACAGHLTAAHLWLSVLTVAATGVATAAGVVAYRGWRALAAAPGSEPPAARRARFVLVTGLFLSGLFVFAIVLGAVPVLFVRLTCA